MRTAGTKLSTEEYESLKQYAEAQGSNVNAILRALVQGVTEGKVEPKPSKDSSVPVRGKIPYCPRCGFIMFFDFHDYNLACIRCGYCCPLETVPRWERGDAVKI
ncbi:hypothetical protein ES703_29965 [subsurface metagenome]